MPFKPMLASPADLTALRFPVIASPKLDGIRATIVGGKLLSRSLRPIPNSGMYEALSHPDLTGLDGELVVGLPTDGDVYHKTTSGVMTRGGLRDWGFHVFDDASDPGGFSARLESARRRVANAGPRLILHEHKTTTCLDDLLTYENQCVTAGYEGLILRDPLGPYKFGRSTSNEGWMLKVKRFEDSEAEVIGVEEEMSNQNTAETNELGRTQRSTAREGLVGKGTMGALVVRDIKSGVEFSIGTGFDAGDRAAVWTAGDVVKYKFFPIGVKDKPRHPVFQGRRSRVDM